MCERLKVTETWMSRYLEIAALPEEILSAFGSPHKIGIRAASQLGPLLRRPETREKLLARAAAIKLEQQTATAKGAECLDPPSVLRRLLSATSAAPQTKHAGTRYAFKEIKTKSGKVLLNTQKVRGGGVRIVAHPKTGASRAELLDAVAKIFEDFPDEEVLG
jgi:ParB family chromosome partitioning protein